MNWLRRILNLNGGAIGIALQIVVHAESMRDLVDDLARADDLMPPETVKAKIIRLRAEWNVLMGLISGLKRALKL